MKLVNSSVRNSATATTSLIRKTGKLSSFFFGFSGLASAESGSAAGAASFIGATRGRWRPNGQQSAAICRLQSWREALARCPACRKGETTLSHAREAVRATLEDRDE